MKKSRVLLLSPNIKGLKDGVNRIQPSLGIGYLAAVLRENGHEVVVRDTALEAYDNHIDIGNGMVRIGESDENIRSFISKLNPDLVGISVLFSNLIEHAYKIAEIVKGIDFRIKVVLGGNHISNALIDYEAGIESVDSRMQDGLLGLQGNSVDYAMRC